MLYSERTRFRQTMKSRSFYKFYRSSRRCDFASIILLHIINRKLIHFLSYKDWFRLADERFDEKQDEYYLAAGLDRQPLYPHTIANILTKLETKYGFKHVSCHGLRHTYCSLLLSQNVPIQTVSKYMGHSDSTVTLEVYSHFIPDTQEKVVLALNNISKK